MTPTVNAAPTPVRLAMSALLVFGTTAACSSAEPGGDAAPSPTSTSRSTSSPTVTTSPAPSASVTPTRTTKLAASVFPLTHGFVLMKMSKSNWDKAFTAMDKDFGGHLSGGIGKHGFNTEGEHVLDIAVLEPEADQASPEQMQALFDDLVRAARRAVPSAKVTTVEGRDMLVLTGAPDRWVWYWISGREFVHVVALDRETGEQFVHELAPLIL